MTPKRRILEPSRKAILATTTAAFLVRLRETEYVREYEARLELDALTTDDPVYHPLGILC